MFHQFRVHFKFPLSDLLCSFKIFQHVILFPITHCVLKSGDNFAFVSDQLGFLFYALQMFIENLLFFSKSEIFEFI